MLKMYQKSSHAGSSPEFWEENWDAGQFEQSLKFCAVDPLRPLFEKYAKPGMTMLEGGCGMGQYVTYYTHRGVNVVGLDFAQRTLDRLNQRVKGLRLCAGDVSRLPFADESFDIYYSGGVVEHFEDGAEESLKEARRVLKKDGVALMSVPYFSPLRKTLLPLKRAEWRTVNESRSDSYDVFKGKKFFQYLYTKREFKKLLDDSGLEVTETLGYSVVWGLLDIPIFRQQKDISANPAQVSIGTPVDVEQIINSVKPASTMKRLIVSEDTNVPLAAPLIRLMRWSSANMMMYVCRRK